MRDIATGTDAQNDFAQSLRDDVYRDLDAQTQARGHTADDMIANNPQVAAIMGIADHRYWIDVAGAYPKDVRTIRALAGDAKTAKYL